MQHISVMVLIPTRFYVGPYSNTSVLIPIQAHLLMISVLMHICHLFQQIYDVCIPTHPMIVYTSIDLYDGPRFKTSLLWFQIQHVPVLSVFL